MKNDSYIFNLLEEIHTILHRIEGYRDAQQYVQKTNLRFVEDDDPHVIPFPGNTSPPTRAQGDLFFPKTTTPDVGTSDEESEQGFVYFTDQEIKQMPKKLQQLIIIHKKRCHMRKKQSGKNTFTYEIRFRADGYNLSACGKTKELAKGNMLKKLKTAKPQKKEGVSVPTTFHSFAMYYFEIFRKEKIAEQTYKNDLSRYQKYLKPHFGEMEIDKITPSECKELIEDVEADGKGKTSDELYSLMSIIFKGAIAHHIIHFSPLSIIQHQQHERKSGTALTREEEDRLLAGLTERPFQIAAALALFCGLRPGEIASAQIQGEFIVAINSKRKHKKTEYKKIPIINKLRPYIKDGIPALPSPQLLVRRIKAVLPNHITYDLRTTFYTRCDEYNVAEPARDEFVGHSKGKLTQAYRDLPDAYLLKEGKKLNEW